MRITKNETMRNHEQKSGNLTGHCTLLAMLCIVLAFCMPVGGVNFYPPVRLGVNQGLATTYVTHVAQDNRGFIWVGSDNALVRALHKRELRTSGKHRILAVSRCCLRQAACRNKKRTRNDRLQYRKAGEDSVGT